MALIKNYDLNLDKMHYRFSHLFQIEILAGCSWSCNGCFVDKSNMGWGEGDDQRFLSLCQEWLESGDYLKDIVIGPTDFMSANNTEKILGSETMQEVLKLFDNITFNSAFLNKNSDEWGKKMSELIPDGKLMQIDIVLNHHRLQWPKYTDAIKRSIELFEKNYQGDFHVTFVVPTTIESFTEEGIYLPRDFSKVEQLIADQFFNITGIHSGNSFLRTASLQEDKGRLISHIRWIRDAYEAHVEKDPEAQLDLYISRRGSPFHQYHAYFNGDWYHCPYLYDEVAIWDESFRIPTPNWRVKEFSDFYDALTLKQMSELKGKPCDGCEFLDICSPLFTPDLMGRLGLNECIVPRKAYSHYSANTWLFRDRIQSAAEAKQEAPGNS